MRPGDIVLVDRDCHKSHHYGMVLAGADVVYLESYPLNEYSMYGAVPLREIKHQLLKLKAAGKLDRVRMLLLTNCTFDGVVYNVERVMEECLAIKPDLVFLWDEAWFGFARFGPTYRQRTAMNAANSMREWLRTEEHAREYRRQQDKLGDADDDKLLKTRLVPPPNARVRVYATQSTHKTLTALRQGSMIHVNDQDFKGEVEQSFHEAYMTHTSTSPNYQIIASLDVGRRQVELEGFELVQSQVEAAMSMRKAISTHPLLQKYFKVLTAGDMIPQAYRESGIQSYFDPRQGWNDIWECWSKDEFVLDATRVTLAVGGTGWDGDTFKTQILMDKYGIQINKTSRNTVLFMTNIGTTRSSVAYLIEVLVEIARELDDRLDDASKMERLAFEHRVKSLTVDLPPLPDFSRFHDAFRPAGSDTPEGDIRSAFFLAYDEDNCDYLSLEKEISAAMKGGSGGRLGQLHHPVPARLPDPGARPGDLGRNPRLHARARRQRDPRLPARPGPARLHRRGSGRPCGQRAPQSRRIAGHPRSMPGAAGPQGITPTGGTQMPKKKLKNISEIRRYFHRNEQPIYFVSATNFNLLGVDEWVKNFKYINYLDCYDGRHPNVFVPPEIPHDEFQSIEDINNYLLQHKGVIDFMKNRGGKPKLVFLMFDEQTEKAGQGPGRRGLVPESQAAHQHGQQDRDRAHRQQGGRAVGPERPGRGQVLRGPSEDLREGRDRPRPGPAVGLWR